MSRKPAWTRHQEPDDAVPQLSRMARYELYLRLKDADKAAEIPLYVLVRAISALNGLEIENKKAATNVIDRPQRHILEIVQKQGLPLDRQIFLLQQAIKERIDDGGDPADLQDALRKLGGEPLALEAGGTNGHHEQP